MARAPRRVMGDMRLRTGDAVRIRNQQWRVAAHSPFGSVSIVEVDGCDATNHGIRARFLLPFEAVDPAEPPSAAPRIVTLERWRRAARGVLAGAMPQWTSLRAAAGANLTVLPFQLEPAVAIARGETGRVLIADEVGLGKTVQAGLIVAETLTRAPEAHVLIVAPAGLREQWRQELQSRFRLQAVVLDTQGIAHTAAGLVPDVNPWSIHHVVITSIDYVKRAEVMRSLETLSWDVLVFDEAHALGGRSDRATAAAALGRRARVVVMLTATPHSGDEEAFSRLSAIGDISGAFPLMTFRRTRADVGLPQNRRCSVLRVRPTAEEASMHRVLFEYAGRLAEDGDKGGDGLSLLASILLRRACSSASSLARSIERRVALLHDTDSALREQLTLPFIDPDSDDEPGLELGVAGLRDAHEEQQWLQRLAALARTASVRESKVQALQRLLRRIREPVIVFTEYRDTLQHLRAALGAFAPLVLHGGLTARERADVIVRFTEGQSSAFLATDAASEGLNLHRRCRFVVNLEIPWTPVRLEQRIGRVDRLGQALRVHALNLMAVDTHDAVMAGRLSERVRRIETALDRPVDHRGLREDAELEANRVLMARRLASRSAQPTTTRALVAVVRRSRRPDRDIRAFQLSFVDESGRVAFDTIAGIVRSGATNEHTMHDDDLAVARHQERALTALVASLARWLALATRREEAIAGAIRDSHARLSAALLQPGLFDRRAERAAMAQASRLDEALERSRARVHALEQIRTLHCGERRLLFEIRFRS